jgi:TRAP transporter TAXI family solute receptor
MKKISTLSAIITLGITLCGQLQAETLTVGTNPQGSLFYSMGAALAKVMAKETDKQYRVAPYAGSSTYIPMINSGRLAYGFANGGEAAFAHKGIKNFDKRPNENLRLVGVAISTQTSFAVATDSNINSIKDLKGKRLGSGYNSGRTFHYYSNAALATSDMTIDDVKKVPVASFVKAIGALSEGRVDAALIPMNVGVGKKAMVMMDNGWRYLSLNNKEQAKKSVSDNLPSARIVSLSPDSKRTGVTENPTHMIEVDFYVLTGAHVSDENVYELVKSMITHKASLGKAFGAFKRFDPEKMAQTNPVPYHPGAIKAYKELGLWHN